MSCCFLCCITDSSRVVNLLRLSLSYIDLDIYNSSEFSHLKNLNDPKYRIICADLIKLGVLPVFLWMQDLNEVVFNYLLVNSSKLAPKKIKFK
jgi:hypothetical protein